MTAQMIDVKNLLEDGGCFSRNEAQALSYRKTLVIRAETAYMAYLQLGTKKIDHEKLNDLHELHKNHLKEWEDAVNKAIFFSNDRSATIASMMCNVALAFVSCPHKYTLAKSGAEFQSKMMEVELMTILHNESNQSNRRVWEMKHAQLTSLYTLLQNQWSVTHFNPLVREFGSKDAVTLACMMAKVPLKEWKRWYLTVHSKYIRDYILFFTRKATTYLTQASEYVLQVISDNVGFTPSPLCNVIAGLQTRQQLCN